MRPGENAEATIYVDTCLHGNICFVHKLHRVESGGIPP